MSSPKQLLKFKGKTLIRLIADHLAALSLLPTLCVTGFLESELHEALEGMDIRFIHNRDHQKGMTSSIRFAMEHAQANCDAVFISLTDQPLIPPSHFKAMVDAAQEAKCKIVATAYKETLGVPALFKSTFFEDLLTLEGKGGAKQLISDHLSNTRLVACEAAERDIDTDDDYQQLIG